MTPAPTTADAAREAIENHVEKVTESGCWIWMGGTQIIGGSRTYGRLWVGGKMVRAHRVSYEVYNGPIPDGMLVCHRCDIQPCVNPAHLFLGTHKDNENDKVRKGRHASQRKESCANGHKFTAMTTTITREGWRGCKECKKEWNRRQRLKAK